MAKPSGKWEKVGSLRQSEKGNLYIKFESDLELSKGDVLNAQKPSDKYASLLKKGMITQEEHDVAVGKIPPYIKLDLFLTPRGGN